MQIYLRAGFSSPVQDSFFLICAGDSASAGYHLRIMPRPASLEEAIKDYAEADKYAYDAEKKGEFRILKTVKWVKESC